MLKFNNTAMSFESVAKSNLQENNMGERSHLQACIIKSWDLFRDELGMPSAYLIGEEITPDNSTQNRLDLLAYDSDDSSLVVIELKKDRNKLQLLQAISYAAMISNWDKETIIEHINRHQPADYEELLEIIESDDFNQTIKIILIAESFDPEVIVTADWLKTKYSLNISAFALEMNKNDEKLFLNVDQRYPPRELSDSYDSRGRSRNNVDIERSWDDIATWCEYDFAKNAIKTCTNLKIGDTKKRCFKGLIRHGFDRFDRISIYFRKKYINVYFLGGNSVEDIVHVKSKFTSDIEVRSWRDGLNILIKTEQQFKEFVALDDRLEYQ